MAVPRLVQVVPVEVHESALTGPQVLLGRLGTGEHAVRCHEAPFALEHGQVDGRLVYERMQAPPARLYGAGIASNYQGQGLKLAKQFR